VDEERAGGTGRSSERDQKEERKISSRVSRGSGVTGLHVGAAGAGAGRLGELVEELQQNDLPRHVEGESH
jgi:hypothetical protein